MTVRELQEKFQKRFMELVEELVMPKLIMENRFMTRGDIISALAYFSPYAKEIRSGRAKFTRSQVLQIEDEWRSGMTQKQIAENWKCSAHTIHNVLKQGGFTRRNGKNSPMSPDVT